MSNHLDAFNVAFGISYKKPRSLYGINESAKVLNLGKLALSVPILGIACAIFAIRSRPEPGRRLLVLRGFIYGLGLAPIGIALDLFASLTTQVHNAVSKNRNYSKL